MGWNELDAWSVVVETRHASCACIKRWEFWYWSQMWGPCGAEGTFKDKKSDVGIIWKGLNLQHICHSGRGQNSPVPARPGSARFVLSIPSIFMDDIYIWNRDGKLKMMIWSDIITVKLIHDVIFTNLDLCEKVLDDLSKEDFQKRKPSKKNIYLFLHIFTRLFRPCINAVASSRHIPKKHENCPLLSFILILELPLWDD